MLTELHFTLAASAVFLGLAVIATLRGRRGPMAAPTAVLCVVLFAYCALEVLGNDTEAGLWEWLESAAAALAAPLLFHLTLAFLGQRKRHRVSMFLAYAYFGALAASCLLPLYDPDLAGYPGGDFWAVLMLAGIVPTFVFAGVALVRHYRGSSAPDERARTQLFIGTVVTGVGGVATDLAFIAGAGSVPQLAAPAMLLSALLLTALAIQTKLMRGAIAVLVINAGLIGVVGVVLHLLVFNLAGDRTALLVLGTVTVVLLLMGAARAVWSSVTEHRSRTAQLATLGRLSSQMAHDIRNPLAAIHGAAQYLEEERARGGSLEDSREFLDLIIEQTERLERVVRDYKRLGEAKPQLEQVDASELVRKVVRGAEISPAAEKNGVEVRAEIAIERCTFIDPELVATALENLVRNAVEVLGADGGTVTVRASEGELGGRAAVIFEVEDDGPGMDPRTLEQAEDAFFTTKATGSGLGLAFVSRVADAHLGQFRIESKLREGTRTRLTLPSRER